MPRYVAFLRAINVGGHVVKMDRLTALFEELRLGNVETFIASGNVLFDTSSKDIAALERRIERKLHDALGYEVDTFVRPVGSLADIATSHPFGACDEKLPALYVGFLKEPASTKAREALRGLACATDEFHVNGREAYWLCRIRSSDSAAGTGFQKALGASTTVRNVNTVRRLAAKA
ncbi:MAG: DUF1697 domain-containing protein [Gemmatimonadaceae bacterium]